MCHVSIALVEIRSDIQPKLLRRIIPSEPPRAVLNPRPVCALATKGRSVGEVIELFDETTRRSRVATVTELTGDYWVWVVVE